MLIFVSRRFFRNRVVVDVTEGQREIPFETEKKRGRNYLITFYLWIS